MNIIEVWLIILSLIVAILMYVIFVVVRQVGILLNHTGPVGARATSNGPRVGENISNQVKDLLGHEITSNTLMIFGASSCAVCASIKKAALSLHKHWGNTCKFMMVYDDSDEGRQAPLQGDFDFFNRAMLRHGLDIKSLPVGIALNSAGYVVAQGLVNDVSNVESLIETLVDQER
ncbi:MAG: hypothetical protein QNK37_12440 [Acidobacteriota bacterium]|nr:hypothetical protein [Acidobacteriota bacterium]